MPDILLYNVTARVATLTLNRPEARNALSPELVSELIRKLREIGNDPEVKCVVIRGAGENFSAGGDVKGFGDTLKNPPAERYDEFERRLLVGNRLPRAVMECPKPVVVVARGAVAGAGMTLCLAADFTLVSDNAAFVAAHIHLGLSLDCGLSGLMIAAMGVKAAKRLTLLGERVSAQDALHLGLVSQVLPDAELEEAAAKLIKKLARGPSIAMAQSKALLNHAAHPDFLALLQEEATGIATCTASADFEAGVQAALNKSAAKFG